MKLAVKILSVVVLIALASPVILLKGCGNILTGGACGGCPSSTAPYGSRIEGPTSLAAPSTTGSCYIPLTFTVLNGSATMDNICVEIHTNGAIALHPVGSVVPCENVLLNPSYTIITTTNSAGAVVVEFMTPAAAAGETFFVSVMSCQASTIVTTPAAI
jgi:hypothetical protein